MEYRAIIQYVDNWWVGWLIDLPGVNAQEKTKKEVIESLKIGAEDLLNTPGRCSIGKNYYIIIFKAYIYMSMSMKSLFSRK